MFNLNDRERWSLKEEELDAYIEESQRAENARRETERNIIQPPDIAESSHQTPGYDDMLSFSSSWEPECEQAKYEPLGWSHYPHWD